MISTTPGVESETPVLITEKTDIYGFSHLHGCGLGAILVMPTLGGVSPAGGPDGWKSSHRHADETMTAGYHKVLLERYGITAEITSTARAGFHRWTYANDGVADIFFDLSSYLSEIDQANAEAVKVGDSEIEGWVRMKGYFEGDNDDAGKVYFVARFSRPFTSLNAWTDEDRGSVASAAGHPLVVYPRFSVKRGDVLTMKIGISFCDITGARRNLETEIGDKDFETTRRESREEWNKELGRVQVTGGSDEQRIKFYTDVWHTLFGRLTLNDADGRYCDRMGDTPVIRQLPMENGRPKHRVFSTDCFWWTMWNLNLWWGMTCPSVIEEWVHDSLLWCDNDPQHRIPWGICNGAHSWFMLGCDRTPLLCNAVQMGIKGISEQKIYDSLKRMHSSPRRGGVGWMDGLDDYLKLGYIPADGNLFDSCRSASLTVDDTYTDWVLAQLAQKLGRDDDYAELMRRSENWKNLWDGHYIRPRNRDGSWAAFDPLVGRNRGYCEANAEQYSFVPVHDVPGVAARMGGFAAYCDRLNADFEEAAKSNFSFFEGQHGGEGHVNYSNEPNLQAAHLFNHAGQPWRSQYWARQVQRHAFGRTDDEGGYALGDEDQGQLGAISALLAVGLFSLRGGCESPPIYEITTPIFDTVTIRRDQQCHSGNQFVIKTYDNSPENHYIQSARLNGKPLNDCWFYQSQFAAGGTLELWLGAKPNTAWGITPPPTVGRPPGASGAIRAK